MQTLDFYIIRRVLGPFLLSLMVLLMVLSLERLLRLVQLVNQQNASSLKIFEFLFYLLPHYMGLAMPASLFLAILIVIRRLYDDSELAVIQSAGTSLRYLYKPLAYILIPTTVFMLILTAFIQPQSRYAYRAALHTLVTDNPLAGLQPNVFYNINDETILRVDSIKEKNILEGVFIARTKIEQKERLVLSAQKAMITKDDTTGEPLLKLEIGNLVLEDENKNKLREIRFQTFPWSLPNAMGEPYGPRGKDEREMLPHELIHGGVTGIEPTSTKSQMITELNDRLIRALSIPFLVLWAIPLAMIGKGRVTKGTGILFGAVLFVLYEKILSFGEAYAANGALPIWLALWTPWLTLGASGFYFMIYKIPNTIKIHGVRI